jgi:hypothetical protein
MSDELRPIVKQWISKLKLAKEHKDKEFGADAEEAMRFYSGPYDFLYGWRTASGTPAFSWVGDEETLAPPSAKMTVNKVAELVQLFGPALYHRNPVRKVNPRKPCPIPPQLLGDPNDPNVQMMFQQMSAAVSQEQLTDMARASLLECYLNYTPTALDLKTESRRVIDEAIIKGAGCWWTELYQPAGASMRMSGSFYDTIDNLQIDPDGEGLGQAKWIARRHINPSWEVERRFALPRGTLKNKGQLESFQMRSQVASVSEGEYQRRRGLTNDLIVWYEVWSKMGLGGRLQGGLKSMEDELEMFGDYCYICLCDTCEYPLNLPPPLCDMILEQDQMMLQAIMPEVMQRIQWPTPFWADDSWPVTVLSFHEVPRQVWPMSHIKPAIGELKFLNWAFSFLAGKVKIASRDFLAIAKSASEDVRNQIKSGPDMSFIEVDQIHGSIDKMVSFLQHPNFNPEIYKVIEGVTTNFERRTGLTELAYGLTDTQIRSAQEAQVKGQAVNVRPDDMSNKVEDAMSDIARKEALTARWHLHGPDVVQVMGQVGAMWWDKLVTPSDPSEIIHSLEYRIEANSAKKPNKALDQQNMQTAMQSLLQPLYTYAQATGNVGPVNALIMAWAKSVDLDASQFTLSQPPPPPPQPQQGGPGGPPQPQQRPSTNGAPAPAGVPRGTPGPQGPPGRGP